MSEQFYETVLPVIGLARTHSDEHSAEWVDFSLAQATEDEPVTRRASTTCGCASRTLRRRSGPMRPIAPFTDFELRIDTPTRASFRGASAGCSLVAGRPTELVNDNRDA